MAQILECGTAIPETEARDRISSDAFYGLLGKKPRALEEIRVRGVHHLPRLAAYQQDLATFLSQTETISACDQLTQLHQQQEMLGEEFQAEIQGRNAASQSTSLRRVTLKEEERRIRGRIANETLDAGIMFGHLRVQLHERRGLAGRALLERVAASIPFLATPIHPLLRDLYAEQRSVISALTDKDNAVAIIETNFTQASEAIVKNIKAEQANLSQVLLSFVTEDLGRALTYLTLFPSESTDIRKAFHERFVDNPELRKQFESGIKELGLPKDTPKARAVAVQKKAVEAAPQAEGSRWGLVLEGYDPKAVLRTIGDVEKAVKALLNGKQPDKLASRIARILSQLQDDPFSPQKGAGALAKESLRTQIGKFEIRLPKGWRGFFDCSTTADGQKVILLHSLISHGDWEKKQH